MTTDTKGVFAILCKTMDRLDSGDITIDQAYAMAKLVSQAEKLLNYELKKALLLSSPYFSHRLKEIDPITISA